MEIILLFLSALLAATLFPGGSELLLLHAIQQGHPAWLCLLAASSGNILGSVITYAMGTAGRQLWRRIPQRLHLSRRSLVRAARIFRNYGSPSLLFAWLPVIGDPLCLLAGIVRYPLLSFLILVSLGKLARYGFLVLIAEQS